MNKSKQTVNLDKMTLELDLEVNLDSNGDIEEILAYTDQGLVKVTDSLEDYQKDAVLAWTKAKLLGQGKL